jgi:hypothetical protein
MGFWMQVRSLLRLGYDALMTDIDVAWLNNPRPYLYCNGVRGLHLLQTCYIFINSLLIMFQGNLRSVLHILSRHEDELSTHLLFSFKTGPSHVCVVVQSPL